MSIFGSITVVIILSTFISAACGGRSVEPNSSSSAGALTANAALNNLAPKRFARQGLNSGTGGYLNEFIRPEVRARLDEEPVGDTDAGFDPGASGDVSSGAQAESLVEAQNEEQQLPQSTTEELASARIDTLKYPWATKAFGDAVKANPAAKGVIVLYADEDYYDVERLRGFVEGGRNRIVEVSAIDGDRVEVVFGGYRAMPQVELWVLPQGSPMPEFKTDERSKPSEPEN